MTTAKLATASASARLSNEPGRALLTVRGQHAVTDSPPTLGGPNESANPVELLLSALADGSGAPGTVLDDALKTQLAGYLQRLTQPVEIVASLERGLDFALQWPRLNDRLCFCYCFCCWFYHMVIHSTSACRVITIDCFYNKYSCSIYSKYF